MVWITRGVLRGVAVAAAVALAYTGGVVTGVVGSSDNDRLAEDSTAGVIDEAADRIQSKAEQSVDRAQLERAAVEGMLKALGDQWSSYYEPGEYASFQEALAGRYSGVGVWLRTGNDGVVQVGSVQQGSPAARGGISVGDEIMQVDGASTAGRSVDEVAALLRGDGSGAVTVRVRTVGVPRLVRLPRAPLTTDDVAVERLQGGVTRLHITGFTRGVGREVRRVLDEDRTAYAGGVVLDLRDNPGGLLDEAVEVASAFLQGGPVVSYERRNESPRVLDALGNGDVTTPVVVLVNGRTASAAEVVAAALQDRNRAVVVGSRTYGKGSVQEPTKLSDGSALELTVAKYRTPNGRIIDGVGVSPDVLVDAALPPQVAEQRAIEVLSGLLAALSPGRG